MVSQGYRWRIFWADLSPSIGSEQSGKRPVVVISTEEANQILPVLTVLPVTSIKTGRKIYGTEVFLPSTGTGLPQDSILMAHQIRTISRERLDGMCGYIKSTELRNTIMNILCRYLDIMNVDRE